MKTSDTSTPLSPSAIADAWHGPVGLTNCDRQPVQFPGAIMPHGVLLLLSPDDFRILGASANTDGWLGCPADSLLGAHLDRALGAEARAALERRLGERSESRPPHYLGRFRAAQMPVPRLLDALGHRSGDYLILELEPLAEGGDGAWPTEHFAEVFDGMAALEAAETWQEGMARAVLELSRLTGFDSVIGARFLPDGSAQAVAETRNGAFPSYLDMRFPRSDIPDPARRQMLLMPSLYAPEHDYEAVPLILADSEPTAAGIDLGLALLRSVSPMCSRFYLNMGVRARLLLSLASQGELWGFLVCWSATPRALSYSQRLACQTFAEMAGTALREKERAARYADVLQSKHRVAELAAELCAAEDVAPTLWQLPERLLGILDAEGAALCMDRRIQMAGSTPEAGEIESLRDWLDARETPLATDRLPGLLGRDGSGLGSATGLLAIRLLEPDQYLLAFRPEWVHEVRWAGDPRKPVEVDETSGETRLTPRGAFEVWKEDVQGRARPWQERHSEAMADLQRAVILAQHAERRRLLQLQLEASNAELESFAYVVSHDLQEPLRGIQSFAQFLRERGGSHLGSDEQLWLETINDLSERMCAQIAALLQYCRAGQAPLELVEVSLESLLKSVLDGLSVPIAESGAEVVQLDALPRLICDPIRTSAIFANLISNGIKYNDKTHKRIEIGCTQGTQGEPVLFVRDNGIGIPERNQQAIFTIFRRLHGRDRYGGGTGAGLTIARKHVEWQGGRLWLESSPQVGSTFYFTLAAPAC